MCIWVKQPKPKAARRPKLYESNYITELRNRGFIKTHCQNVLRKHFVQILRSWWVGTLFGIFELKQNQNSISNLRATHQLICFYFDFKSCLLRAGQMVGDWLLWTSNFGKLFPRLVLDWEVCFGFSKSPDSEENLKITWFQGKSLCWRQQGRWVGRRRWGEVLSSWCSTF